VPDELTLRTLAQEPGLGLRSLDTGDLSAVVRGAHTMEIDHPARWLRPGFVMLTTGLRFTALPDNAPGQAELVDELVEAGVAGLLFGVGVHFAEPPGQLVTRARSRALPMLTVSPETPFIVIEDFVNRSVLSSDTYLLKRALWLQNDLLRSLSAPDPLKALVTRLGALSKGTAVLYEASGRIVASTGEGPLRLVWQEAMARGEGSQRFSVGRWEVATRPFLLRGSGFLLAIASRSGSLIDNLGGGLLETAQHLLAAANGMRALSMNQERAEAARLISALRSGIPVSQVRQTWDRLRAFRLRPGTRVRVVAAGLREERYASAELQRPADVLLEEAQLHGLGVVVHEDEDPDELSSPLTAIVADGPGCDAWLSRLGETHHVGVSGASDDLTGIPDQFREAYTAWQLVIRRCRSGGTRTIVKLDEVDLATWLTARRDDQQVAARVAQQFRPLIQDDDLRRTVIAYLACHQDVRSTARRLFLHPNTVRYRLNKAEKVLGARIDAPSTITNLYLAFQEDILAFAAILET
jgi:purine catabolism regulator